LGNNWDKINALLQNKRMFLLCIKFFNVIFVITIFSVCPFGSKGSFCTELKYRNPYFVETANKSDKEQIETFSWAYEFLWCLQNFPHAVWATSLCFMLARTVVTEGHSNRKENKKNVTEIFIMTTFSLQDILVTNLKEENSFKDQDINWRIILKCK
jgi:hypothetical protein